MGIDGKMNGAWISFCVVCALLTAGCVAQEADLKRTERDLQQRIRQAIDESSQSGARQSHEISALREQEMPQLRGDVDRALHQAQELKGKQDDLKQQNKKLEQLTAKIEGESATRYAWAQKNFETQGLKSKEDREQFMAEVNARLEDVNRQAEMLRKDLIEVVHKTSGAVLKTVDARLEEQQKTSGNSQVGSEQLVAQGAQFSRSLAEFRDLLAGLNERLSQEEQASKASMAHLNGMNKSVTGYLSEVNKSLIAVTQKFAARFDEQDQRLDALSRAIDQDAHLRGKKSGAPQPATKPSLQSSMPAVSAPPHVEQESAPIEVAPAAGKSGASAPPHVSQGETHQEKPEYERLLTLFRRGDLDGAKEGFVAFLRNHPDSDLSPNAQYWLGESYYGKKDYRQAIDSYDRVELDFPKSEKVPAALLKKGYAYLEMKDKKRASSAFKQVTTLYPRSSEAGKASDKLSQLKE